MWVGRERRGGEEVRRKRECAVYTVNTLLTNYCKISESDTNIYLNLNVQVGQIG